jgi:hypothetical protein
MATEAVEKLGMADKVDPVLTPFSSPRARQLFRPVVRLYHFEERGFAHQATRSVWAGVLV